MSTSWYNYLSPEKQAKHMSERVRARSDELRKAVQKAADKANGYEAWQIIEESKKFFDGEMPKFWAWIDPRIAQPGDAANLLAAAKKWDKGEATSAWGDSSLNGVKPAYESACADIDLGKLTVDDTWRGRAAAAYTAKVPAQRQAADSLGRTAATVEKQLVAWYRALRTFWYSVAVGLAKLVNKLAEATNSVSSCSPETALKALATANYALSSCWGSDMAPTERVLTGSRREIGDAFDAAQNSLPRAWPAFIK
jgi:uncharacterized protein YukE